MLISVHYLSCQEAQKRHTMSSLVYRLEINQIPNESCSKTTLAEASCEANNRYGLSSRVKNRDMLTV